MKQQIKDCKSCKVFKFIKLENGKIIIVAGSYKVSEKTFDTFEQAEKYVGTKPYEIIFNFASLLIELNNEKRKTKKQTKTTEQTNSKTD